MYLELTSPPIIQMAEGIYLGNYSTGKFNFSNECTEEDLDILGDKFVSAGLKMRDHGFFEPTSSSAKRNLIFNVASRFSYEILRQYYNKIMEDKHIDIEVSHNHPVNKWGHFWSSLLMIIYAYPNLFYYGEAVKGCTWFFITHVIRQSGHFFYEKQDKDIEKRKFGHKDKSKKVAAASLFGAALLYKYRMEVYDYLATTPYGSFIPNLNTEQYVVLVCLFTVVPHYVEITYQYGFLRGLSWALKILTDPFTDLLDFYTHIFIHPKHFLDLKNQKAIYSLDINTKAITIKKIQ